MKLAKFTEEEILRALRQVEGGTSVAELCRRTGFSERTFTLEAKFGQMGVTELCKLRQLEEESRKLKHLIADLSLDKQRSAADEAHLRPETCAFGKQLLPNCISVNGCFHFRLASNFEVSKNLGFLCTCVKLLLPFAASGRVKSHR